MIIPTKGGLNLNSVLFSSQSVEWETPEHIFSELNTEFHFDLDPCASDKNHKCRVYFTKGDDGLSKEWFGHVFMNPPYGREIGKWIQKAFKESLRGVVVVSLLPARTDTRWFHDYIYGKAEIRFIRGRLKFNQSHNSAPFPSMITIHRGEKMSKNVEEINADLNTWIRIHDIQNKYNRELKGIGNMVSEMIQKKRNVNEETGNLITGGLFLLLNSLLDSKLQSPVGDVVKNGLLAEGTRQMLVSLSSN